MKTVIIVIAATLLLDRSRRDLAEISPRYRRDIAEISPNPNYYSIGRRHGSIGSGMSSSLPRPDYSLTRRSSRRRRSAKQGRSRMPRLPRRRALVSRRRRRRRRNYCRRAGYDIWVMILGMNIILSANRCDAGGWLAGRTFGSWA